MKAFDTNILARYLTRDDAAQAEQAARLLAEPGFVSDTVLLETAWLLASRYRIGRSELAGHLRDLLSLPQLNVSDPAGIAWAIERFAAGGDFADMLHLVSARGADSFVTFDRALAAAAGPGAPVTVKMPH